MTSSEFEQFLTPLLPSQCHTFDFMDNILSSQTPCLISLYPYIRHLWPTLRPSSMKDRPIVSRLLRKSQMVFGPNEIMQCSKLPKKMGKKIESWHFCIHDFCFIRMLSLIAFFLFESKKTLISFVIT